MSRLYLDTCCIIYLIEASSPLHEKVAQRLLAHRSDPTAVLLTSRLSRLECRVKPLRDADAKLLADYDGFFTALTADAALAKCSAVNVEIVT